MAILTRRTFLKRCAAFAALALLPSVAIGTRNANPIPETPKTTPRPFPSAHRFATAYDGIPDAGKNAHGVKPATDYTGVSAPSGYDHIENYLKDEAGDPPPEGGYPRERRVWG